jgi:hypothetical protein
VRVQAALDHEHGRSISFTLCRGLHTLPTAHVKVLKNFGPNHVMLAMHHTTLLRCDCIGTLRSLYKGMQKTNDPHSYGSGRTITSLVVSTLAKAATPKEPGYTPTTRIPLCSFQKRVIKSIAHLINWLRSEPYDIVIAHVFLGGSPYSDYIIWSCITKRTINIKHTSFCHGKPFYPTQVEQLAYSTQKYLLNRVVPKIMDKSLGKSLKRVFPSI